VHLLSASCDAANAGERFRAQLANTPEVKIPRTYVALSTEKVLITEWVHGTPLSQLRNNVDVAKRLVQVPASLCVCSLSAAHTAVSPPPSSRRLLVVW
jgi:hypothetical protein